MTSIYLSPSFGDRLAHFHDVWGLITTDSWVLHTIRMSYEIQFLFIPLLHPPTLSVFRDLSHEILLFEQIQSLLELGAVKEVPLQIWGQRFYSQYFLVPKFKGGVKPILDLCNFNKYIRYVRFQMSPYQLSFRIKSE